MTHGSDLRSLEQKVGQLFFIGIGGPEIDTPARYLLDQVLPGGVCLFARNIKEAAQTRALCDALNNVLDKPILSIDQEGGLVDRLRRIMTPMPAASKLADARQAAELASIIAETLRTLGFNMDFAPVVDVIDDERGKFSNGLFSRTFGTTNDDVTRQAGAFLDALQAGGITGCLKHFPGLGAARVDSHEELPVVEISAGEMSETDLYPYRELLGTKKVYAVMAAHASFPHHALQETGRNGKLLPSSLSYNFVTTLLRGTLAFDGLVITDDLEMGAIIKNYGIGDACKMALAAGADMLAICADPQNVKDGYNAVLEAVKSGEISLERLDRSLERIAAVKDELAGPLVFDQDRLDHLSARVTHLLADINRS